MLNGVNAFAIEAPDGEGKSFRRGRALSVAPNEIYELSGFLRGRLVGAYDARAASSGDAGSSCSMSGWRAWRSHRTNGMRRLRSRRRFAATSAADPRAAELDVTPPRR